MKSFKSITRKAEDTFDQAKIKVKDALNLFDPVIIYPYAGYGNGNKAQIHGRILEKERMIHEDQELEDTFWNNLRKIWKRYESDEIPGVELEGDIMGIKAKTTSDEEGYFNLVFDGINENNAIHDGWLEVTLRITHMPFDVEYQESTTASILNCSQQNDFGIISDVDDTIIESKAMNIFKKMQIMLTENAKTRVAFEGVDELYRKLMDNGRNPLFFVSGSSFNLYDMLVNFCEFHNIPKAPFFLRNLGLEPKQWIKQDTSVYKKQHIEHILEFYDQLSFIFIGDSGQQDPEIYMDIHKKHPGRVKAIYIRHLESPKRKQQLEEMSSQVDIPFLIMENTDDALEHVIKMGWTRT